MNATHTQVSVRLSDLTAAGVLLRRVEGEIADDWRYHDFPDEALEDIKALAKALRSLFGVDSPA